jgi:CubicO group peptidase (beta-lactamase class C family)
MPYDFGGAGTINSTTEDLGSWVRLLLADGEFEGKRIVSAENLAVTRMARVALSDKVSYAMGWILQSTPNGDIIWHNGGTMAFGSYIGIVPDHDIGVIVLTNETNVRFPDAIGEWTLDRLLGNAEVDHVAAKLAAARAGDEATAKLFAKPADAQPPIPLAPLAGTYTNPVWGKTEVRVDGGALLAPLSTGATLKLDPWNGDIFTISLVPEGEMVAVAANLGPSPLGFAQFQIDPSGQRNAMSVRFQQEGQTFVFTRSD